LPLLRLNLNHTALAPPLSVRSSDTVLVGQQTDKTHREEMIDLNNNIITDAACPSYHVVAYTCTLFIIHLRTKFYYRAMLCIRGTSHGPVSVSVLDLRVDPNKSTGVALGI